MSTDGIKEPHWNRDTLQWLMCTSREETLQRSYTTQFVETRNHETPTVLRICVKTQALDSFNKYMSPPLPYFKVNICPFPLPHFASILFAYLWSFRWPNYIVTLPRYFSFRLPHLNIPTGAPWDELDKNIQRTSLRLLFSHWNGYSHFRSGLNWFRK
jgi:hypothetical protein